MFDIWNSLCYISTDEVLKDVQFAFRGGTTLSKVYFGSRQRISEEINLDIFFKDGMTREEAVDFVYRKIVSRMGPYEVDGPFGKGRVSRHRFTFTNELGSKDHVYVDFNIKTTAPVYDTETRGASSIILPLNIRNVPVYPFHVILAQKLIAFHDRAEGKDLYDIHTGLAMADKLGPVLDTLREILAAINIDYSDFKERIVEKLSDYKAMWNLHLSLNPYVLDENKLDWGKAAQQALDRLGPHL
ncbi:conserved hypothetical protein [Cenarchaeum symbiosum A]|uniref:Nucleotidyl transferase AbiEii/AbiGii toxin family protein n=1 Tax=Cenarchaeum symbiosum (strain A) TaxID=414004 RepID=A0RUS7_CENSY|nr:conserved hypothetical protein [Cenarchaeum symbiosum A]